MNSGVAYYDLDRNPPTFNALDFLMQAERWRRESSIDTIDVKVLPGRQDGFRNDSLPPYGAEERTRWRDNIVVPMPRLLPSCGKNAECVGTDYQDERPTFGRGQYTVGAAKFRQAFERSEYFFKVPDDAAAENKHRMGNADYVTLTLRNTGWWVERSADPQNWQRIGQGLRALGLRVIAVPDGSKDGVDLHGFENDRAASHNVLRRAALYGGAALNIGICGGPMWLCWFLGLPALLCKMVNENEPCSGAAVYRERMGLDPGRQPPHIRPRQWMLWDGDDADLVLKKAYALLKTA